MVFTWCILTPAVVTLCDMNINIASVFSMNEEENSETFKLGAKEYNAPESINAKFISIELFENSNAFGYRSQFWEKVSQETFSPPPEYI
ncbi:hypothetical protein G5B37_10780 [Rasiella rasia]|uniref:Uncharacterized protein n=1 Tax=Rasiella rasia TaxID=2744027 RepID=A0A6G6GNG0_9FLAO|nr:hypothetical protein [Rasiella rasia]QIE60030.1 hypothetical protein G5B37_10780 [Rasiella rasia]